MNLASTPTLPVPKLEEFQNVIRAMQQGLPLAFPIGCCPMFCDWSRKQT